jgi:hypothetical protein
MSLSEESSHYYSERRKQFDRLKRNTPIGIFGSFYESRKPGLISLKEFLVNAPCISPSNIPPIAIPDAICVLGRASTLAEIWANCCLKARRNTQEAQEVKTAMITVS